jgi:hypothetical protein
MHFADHTHLWTYMEESGISSRASCIVLEILGQSQTLRDGLVTFAPTLLTCSTPATHTQRTTPPATAPRPPPSQTRQQGTRTPRLVATNRTSITATAKRASGTGASSQRTGTCGMTSGRRQLDRTRMETGERVIVCGLPLRGVEWWSGKSFHGWKVRRLN